MSKIKLHLSLLFADILLVLSLILGSTEVSLSQYILPSIEKSLIYVAMSLIWALSFVWGVTMVLLLGEERALKTPKLLIYKVFKVLGVINLFILGILAVSTLLFSTQNLLVILAVAASPFVFLGLIFISEIILSLKIKKHQKERIEIKYSSDFKQKLISVSIASAVIFGLLGYFNYNIICTKPAWFSCESAEFNPEKTRGNNLIEDQKMGV